MKRITPPLTLLLLFLAAGTVRAAQSVTIDAGGFVRTNANAQSGSPSAGTYTALGVFYSRASPKKTQSVTVGAYADLLGFGSGSGTSAGIGAAARTNGEFYGGAGAGIYTVTIAPPAACAEGSALGGCAQQTHSARGVGAKLFAGTEIGSGAELEVDYHIMPPANGISTNAMSVVLGLRL